MNFEKLIIRLAKDEDFEKILQIWLEGVENSFDITLYNQERVKSKFKTNFQNRNGIFNFWVAEKDKEILGWQSLIKSSNNPFRSEKWAESSTYFNKTYRFKGLGKLIIEFVLNEAEKSELEFIQGYGFSFK